ncbi:hypothetical protein F0562_000351 [Nyssa sinensis]|uniref:PGG domain-containing protein n=1 Tax=Nyssa sinensis TaxID=561372 RepID=A0A5J5C411_9ASTE|nr:hypothetical protein F0562_000351 [Nyssa sinensis]
MENPSQAVRPASCTSLMDPSLYKAAMIGDASVLEQNKGQLDVLVSPNNNTVLHIAAQYGQLHCVERILGMCPIIYDRLNSKGETPVHVAARERNIEIARALIEHAKDEELGHGVGAAKELLMLANKDKDTALHEAVRSRHAGLVKLLTAEAPELSYIANNAKETPLYLAAERGRGDLVSGILTNCRSPDFGGPYGRTALLAAGGPYGRTALHASVFQNFEECTKQLLDWKQDLLKEADMYGWIPLHYAARSGFTPSVEQQLDKDKSVAYIMTDNDDKMTAIHIAATYGKVRVIEVLMSKHPGCCEMVNSRGQNILHIATKNREKKAIKGLGANTSWRNIFNMNTVRADQVPKDIRKAADTHLIVAALIATVTFAAGFTVPGGLDGNQGPNQGLAVFARKAAFQTFAITDTVAMMFSTCAIIIHFAATNSEDKSQLEREYATAQIFTLDAMIAAAIAFTTGMFAVLSHSLWLAIIQCIIGACGMLYTIAIMNNVVRKISLIKNLPRSFSILRCLVRYSIQEKERGAEPKSTDS